MRYGPDDTFWFVTNPKPDEKLEDMVFEAPLRDIALWLDENPALFTDQQEARREAYGRLTTTWVYQAMKGPRS